MWQSALTCCIILQSIVNPTALIMAKTLWSFGHSECNRVIIHVFLLLAELCCRAKCWCPPDQSPTGVHPFNNQSFLLCWKPGWKSDQNSIKAPALGPMFNNWGHYHCPVYRFSFRKSKALLCMTLSDYSYCKSAVLKACHAIPGSSFALWWPGLQVRAREIDKCQSVRLFSKWSAISGRTYGNSRLEVYVRIYVTFEFRKSLDRGYRREFWCIYLYIAASLFTKYLFIFLDVLSAERILKIKILRNFRE